VKSATLLATAFASVVLPVPTAIVILVRDIPSPGPWGRILIPLGAALVGIAMGAFTLNFAGKARRLIRSVALVGLCLSRLLTN